MALASSKEFVDIQANYRVWIHSETRTWHDNNIQSETECFNAYSSTIFGILIVTVVFGMHYSLLQS